MIRLSLLSLVAFNISNENTMKDLMAPLSQMYDKPSVLNKVFLMKKLLNMKMGMRRCGGTFEQIQHGNLLVIFNRQQLR